MTSLNESQRRAILFSFLDIHRHMADLEAMLCQSTSSPFSQYTHDLSPAESRLVQDYFARLRTTMLACLQEADIPLDMQRTSLRWAFQCGINFLNIAVAEMAPERLRGYGLVDEAGRAQVIKIQENLSRLIDRVSAYLRQGLGRDLAQRVALLGAASAGVNTLTVLEKIVTRWQLVEFRPLLDMIVRRLEAPQFEIAVFGRVNSGSLPYSITSLAWMSCLSASRLSRLCRLG